jgi:hypothetical protein
MIKIPATIPAAIFTARFIVRDDLLLHKIQICSDSNVPKEFFSLLRCICSCFRTRTTLHNVINRKDRNPCRRRIPPAMSMFNSRSKSWTIKELTFSSFFSSFFSSSTAAAGAAPPADGAAAATAPPEGT